jgi:pyrroline-5-carboxylate reductase
MRVGFVGAGNMAAAMARGWAGGPGGPDLMLFFDIDSERARALAGEVGGETAPGGRELAESVDLVVLAVKPASLEPAAREMGSSAPALLSLLGATPIAQVQADFPAVPVIRIIPNQPVEVRRGVLCYTAAADVSPELDDHVRELLSPLGTVVPLEEKLLNAATAIMSCSPAYLAEIAGALAEAGSVHGMAPEVSLRLVAETLAGTGELLSHRDPAAIRGAVATPGGITEKGLEALEAKGMSDSLREAVDVTMERMGG